MEEKEKESVELTFYDSRGGEWKINTAVHAYLSDGINKAVKKAAKSLGMKASEITLITPQGNSVPVRKEGQTRTVKDIVTNWGLSFGLITKDVLGMA
ncbi:MAG: hypothetical protein GWO20_19255 [Candidatus Korarchaeota archaeon]|nr:hypothetical protein [Candidatus Korarchaeota archaeon]NIU85391.1 hypothetical protein [Candidatus Thorarchaeota archaeon]NIW15489.1 hypothetical protein [Candidatus Thorarchaeota archaeon]NIW53433.1 hypothetical protein [Candidatus Korarchaeota archaeon]